FGDLIDLPASPSVNRRVHIAKSPFVSRNLSVGMHVPFTQEQYELALNKLRVDASQRNHMEGKIPSRIPGIFPLLWHRTDVAIEQVHPIAVSAGVSAVGDRRRIRISSNPRFNDVVIVLL